VAPPTNRIYGGGETDLRGFDIRAATPYTFVPVKVDFNLTNPDGTLVPRDPTNPSLGNIQIPLPIYRLVSVGGDTQLTLNMQYQIPIVNQVSFDFFTDFGMTAICRRGSCCRASPARRCSRARCTAARRLSTVRAMAARQRCPSSRRCS
jgi:outer membrane protein assembly factor BamA